MAGNAPSPDQLQTIVRLAAGAGLTVFAQDSSLRYRWMLNPPEGWPVESIEGRTDHDVLPASAATTLQAAKRETLADGRPRWTGLLFESGDESRSFEIYLEPDADGLIGLAIETSRHSKRSPSVARADLHRTKNLLAIVQSLATQTAKTEPLPDAFIEAFRGRVQAIVAALDLSAGDTGEGVLLSALIEAQVLSFARHCRDRIEREGEDALLSANAGLHVGLALHELCSTSLGKGVLSAATGVIRLSAIADTENSLRLVWRESGGPIPDEIGGFSRTLLERIAPAAVRGVARITADGEGWLYELTIAPSEFGKA